MYLMKVRKARKPDAASPLKRKRAGPMAKYRKLTAGGNQSATVQHSSELKSLPTHTRLSICDRAGVMQKVKFSCKDQLAMKTAMKMTWAQSQTHRRFLHKLGISYESEKTQRSVREHLLSSCKLSCNMMQFWEKDELHPNSTCGMLQRDAPAVFIENLPEFVTMLLDEYEKAGKLV